MCMSILMRTGLQGGDVQGGLSGPLGGVMSCWILWPIPKLQSQVFTL